MAAASTPASPEWWKWFNREVLDRVEITGYRQLAYHAHEVSGDTEAFGSLNYGGLGGQRFTDLGSISVQGRKVLGLFTFDAHIQDSRFLDPQGQRFTISYDRKGLELAYGDVQGSLLNTNKFAAFSRSLKGFQATYITGKFTARALRSQPKSDARTITIPGNNSAGPYYLQSSQIVQDSERVTVDDQPQALGTDYSIDYEIGSLTFISRIVPPTSTIVVTYEAFGSNRLGGLIQGAGASYDFGPAGRVAVNVIEQRTGGARGFSTRTDRFQGFGDPSTPYFLTLEPWRDRPIIVRVDGILQVEGIDYDFDLGNPSVFYFRRFMPSTSTIEVTYTPRPTTTVDGDRDVLGIDYRLPLGRDGWLSYAQAMGRLKSDVNPMSGLARSVDLAYNLGMLRLGASWRDVPAEFVSVQSRTFSRNERALDWTLEAKPTRTLTYGFSHGNSSIAQRRVQPDGTITFEPSRFTLARLYARHQPLGESASWSVEHRRADARTTRQSTRADTTRIDYATRLKAVSLRTGLTHQSGRGPFFVDGATRNDRFTLDALTLDATYEGRRDLRARLGTSFNVIRAGGATSSGQSVSLDASYTPGERWRLFGRYAFGQAAGAGLTGFGTGYGLGYDGNGFSSGVGDTTPLTSTNASIAQFGVEHRLSESLAVDARYYRSRTDGPISSNTDSTQFGAGLGWSIGGHSSLRLDADRFVTRFVGSGAGSSTTTLGLSFDSFPAGRFSYRVGASSLLGSGGQFAQDALSLDLIASYRLRRREALSLTLSTGQTRGYYPQNSAEAALSYQYQIWENLALNVRYVLRDVRNRDPNLVGGAYRSSGFDIELAFNFGR